jgi:hypothetical protein
MSRNRISRPQAVAVVLAGALSMLVVGSALAAHPKAGKSYAGFTSAGASNGFKPPVSFKVSSDGKRMLGFKYSAGDCGGMGGPGNPWRNPELVRKVGTIKVDSKGNFSIKNAKWKIVISGSKPPVTKYSYSTVSGHFKTTRKATGTITLKVKIGSSSCPSEKLSFAATTS